ncbi:MAG: hypothetical protein HFI89_12035 [Lachnospiraceae bacterium]|nr:hypothetical protein [Lachnospiraceae bacterium]
MRNILVLYNKEGIKNRKNLEDSIFCFEKYDKNDKFYYFNYWRKLDVSTILNRYVFDGVIYHYSLMALRYNGEYWNEMLKRIRLIKGIIQAAIVQDEYINSKSVIDFIIQQKVNVVFTLAKGKSIRILYPDIPVEFVTVFPGYVDLESLRTINRLRKEIRDEENTIDIGYRARKTNYSLGKQGYLKVEVADIFKKKIYQNNREIKFDIEMTGDTKNVFMGLDWYRFLIKCRTMLGCLGGASILDSNGIIYNEVNKYIIKKPYATFQEVYDIFLRQFEGNLEYATFSPRFFECAMTKTCQVLVEGDYYGIMLPDIHYIEVKRDYSNIDEVIMKIMDIKFCEQIAENAFRDLIANNKFTYNCFVNTVINNMFHNSLDDVSKKSKRFLNLELKSYDILLHLKDRLNTLR